MKSHPLARTAIALTFTTALAFTLTLIAVVPAAAHASALLTIQGKLTSITATDYLVETKSMIYYINREKVTPDQVAKIKSADVDVALTVDSDAIDLVKRKPKTAKQ